MNSSDYYKMVREYANKHGVSIEQARSEIGKRGAEARKRKIVEKKNQENPIENFWWNDKD